MIDEVIYDHEWKELPDNTCPSCGMFINAATACDAEKGYCRPKPGDVSVCGGCGCMLQFTDLMITVEITPAMFEDLPDEAKEILTAVSSFVKEHNP